MNHRIVDIIREAAVATGPLTDSRRIAAYIKDRYPKKVPLPQRIVATLTRYHIARPTGRRVYVDVYRCYTIAEFEVLEVSP